MRGEESQAGSSLPGWLQLMPRSFVHDSQERCGRSFGLFFWLPLEP